ncbi:tyrosine-type recombinase/integrase [Ornithinimicrobium sediminis]|uniref:tyrosine-type recombinase/integrase n=1 Tax=Ornithinimicrobium sediminis TaxID=2904603 RepID=UPI001E4FB3E9|nr:site-specific integrase [Ornithinimicrobium sediminis]
MPAARPVIALPFPADSPDWATAAEVFLRRDLAPGTRRVYRLTLKRVGAHLPSTSLHGLSVGDVALGVAKAYPAASAASWNRVVATVRSFLAFNARHGWASEGLASGLERRTVVVDHNRALSRDEVDRLLSLRTAHVRDRALWTLLYESAARAKEVLLLNVEDLDLSARQAHTIRKGGDIDTLHFATRTARLLPKIIDGRAHGPLFRTHTPYGGTRVVAAADTCPDTGRGRLSYDQAQAIFKEASRGRTLHQLRHSAITHLAEQGVPLPLLMAKSRHTSLATLQRYARPSQDAVARLTATHDPLARR